MTSTELRIGNLIQCYRKAFDKEKTQHKISGIFFLDEFGDCVELEDGFIININKGIEPIPLTEEWLLKLGFELYSEKEYHGNGLYPILVWDDGFWLDDNETGTINDKPILYVHQLQNIHFVLTGEELVCK